MSSTMATIASKRSQQNARKSKSGVTFPFMIIVMLSLVISGVVLCVMMMNPASSKTKENLRSTATKRIQDAAIEYRNIQPAEVDGIEMPSWDQEFWTPIDLQVIGTTDAMVSLCKLNFKEYSQSPHVYPMFHDLQKSSFCIPRRERLSVLMKEINDQQGQIGGRVVEPSGFVFHESRVGSTLVANTLASDPWSMVFSESAPAANALLNCDACDIKTHAKLFRDIVTVMGRSPFHKRLFFKFQSITSTKMEIALQAFPNTSWAFVYRQPVQTMMSHLDPKKGSSSAPCLRSMMRPPQEVAQTIADLKQAEGAAPGWGSPKEAWCAAHLNMLCNSALRAYEKYGTQIDEHGAVRQRGMLVNYESLPGIVPRVLLPMFDVQPNQKWMEKMAEESGFYSKGRASDRIFLGDSSDKDRRATSSIQKYANSVLQPTFVRLSEATVEGLQRLDPVVLSLAPLATADGISRDWTAVSAMPL